MPHLKNFQIAVFFPVNQTQGPGRFVKTPGPAVNMKWSNLGQPTGWFHGDIDLTYDLTN